MAYGAILQGVSGVFNAIAKTKKPTWKAMGGAMKAAKGAAGPFGAIAKALKVFAPIITIINALFKLLGASILKTVMPAMKPFLEMLTSPIMLALMEDIGKIIGIVLIPVFEILTMVLGFVAPIIKKVTEFFLENEWALNALILVLAPLLGILKLIIDNWDLIGNVLKNIAAFIMGVLMGAWNLLLTGLKFAANGFIWFINTIIGGINLLMNILTAGLWGDLPSIPYLHSGIDYVPRTQPYMLEQGEKVISARNNKETSEIHIHIDLRNAVVDNVDRLSQRIAEQVLIQIG